jgi:hypothetical protein
MDEKRRWAVAVSGATSVIVLLVWIFRLPVEMHKQSVAVTPTANVVLIEQDSAAAALIEQAVMQDTTPLFLPTERNARVSDLPRREPGKRFLDNDSLKLRFGDAGLRLLQALPPTVTLNGKTPGAASPEDALGTGGFRQSVLGFGRMDVKITFLPSRGGFIEIMATASGGLVLAEQLPGNAAPPTDKEWQPMEFLAAIDEAGLVAPLVLTEGSRVEEVDTYFRKFLSRTFRIGARLPPGFYRVIIGP